MDNAEARATGASEARLAFNLDRIARLAAQALDAPQAAIFLNTTEGVAGKAGGDLAEGPDWTGFVAAVAARRDIVVCLDPAPVGDLAFLVGQPILSASGAVLGVLVVTDRRAHGAPGSAQREALADLAALTADALDRPPASAEAAAFDHDAFITALSAARIGVFEWDLSSDTLLLSPRLRDMLGTPDDRVPADWSTGLGGLVHPDDREASIKIFDDGLQEDGRYQLECRIVRPSDGNVIWVSSIGVLVADSPGAEPSRMLAVVQDITERKLASEHRETLVAELDHRVKNVLSAVQSLAAQSARKAISLEAFLKTFTGRLKSMASAHQLLTATRWRGATMGGVAAAELGGIAPGQTRWEGPDLLLTPRAASAMSLALHELAINAVKYGALSIETGRVDVRWISLADGGLELQWTESFGPRVTPPTRRGFGATLLEDVTGRDLGGEVKVEYRREGVSVVIRASADAITAPLASEPEPSDEAAPSDVHETGQAYVARAARIDGLRVLIVEDALLLALELEAGLEEAGAIVAGSAADVGEAMALIDQPLDAAVLDANLNGASVMPVAEALAARGVPFVFATGYGDSRFNLAGFDAPVIRKPYDVTQVAAALAEVTGRT